MHPSLSLSKSKIKILLLEGVDPSSVETLKKAGYTNVEYEKKALDGQELLDRIADVHFLGIRSRPRPSSFAPAQSANPAASGMPACSGAIIGAQRAAFSNTPG